MAARPGHMTEHPDDAARLGGTEDLHASIEPQWPMPRSAQDHRSKTRPFRCLLPMTPACGRMGHREARIRSCASRGCDYRSRSPQSPDGHVDRRSREIRSIRLSRQSRMNDRSNAATDDADGAIRHYDERAVAALVLSIAATNLWNRLNVAVRQGRRTRCRVEGMGGGRCRQTRIRSDANRGPTTTELRPLDFAR